MLRSGHGVNRYTLEIIHHMIRIDAAKRVDEPLIDSRLLAGQSLPTVRPYDSRRCPFGQTALKPLPISRVGTKPPILFLPTLNALGFLGAGGAASFFAGFFAIIFYPLKEVEALFSLLVFLQTIFLQIF